MDISVGDRFSRLAVITDKGSLGKFNRWHKRSLCRCDCGTEKIIANTHLLSGNTKSCGCLRIERIKEANTGPRKDASAIALKRLHSIKRRYARNKDLEFSLTLEEFSDLSQQDCFYCGISPSNQFNEYKATRENPFEYSGIDRFNNTEGYTISNSVACCKVCNLAKRDMTIEDFVAWVDRVHSTFFLNYRGG